MSAVASSLALCIDAPMQSWGTTSRFIVRDTATEPTKSGVVGLLASALGVARDDTESIAQLAELRMGVRVDREGIIERDYHTTQNVPTTMGGGHRTIVSNRYYLADAVFLVVLEGDPSLLTKLHAAVQHPHWPLFFGRKAFVPARPLVASGQDSGPRSAVGLVNKRLDVVLAEHPWLEISVDRLRREVCKIEQERRSPCAPSSTATPHPLGRSHAATTQFPSFAVTAASPPARCAPGSYRSRQRLSQQENPRVPEQAHYQRDVPGVPA